MRIRRARRRRPRDDECLVSPSLDRRRCRDPGKDDHARVRGRHDQPAGSQSVESEPYSRRQLGWLSGRGGGWRLSGSHGFGYGWQHPHSGRGLWRHRIQARVWSARCRRSLPAVVVPRYGRTDRADGRRRLDHVERVVEHATPARATPAPNRGRQAAPHWCSAVVLLRFPAPGCALGS